MIEIELLLVDLGVLAKTCNNRNANPNGKYLGQYISVDGGFTIR